MKRCSACGVVKPLWEYHNEVRKRDGRASLCIVCANAKSRRWRTENPDRKRAQGQRWRDEQRRKGKCKDCSNVATRGRRCDSCADAHQAYKAERRRMGIERGRA